MTPITSRPVGIAGMELATVSVADLRAGLLPECWSAVDVESAVLAARYIEQFLARKHAMLGRCGPVCPFVRAAVAQSRLRIAISAATAHALDLLEAEIDAPHALHDELVRTAPPDEQRILTSMVLMLPRFAADAFPLIDEVQHRLKPRFVACGHMIGQFYPGCAAPGLRNPAFRPLDSPTPFIAIRHMAVADAPFMLDHPAFEEAFVRFFGPAGEKELAAARAAAYRAR